MFLSTCLTSSTRTIMSFCSEFMLHCELVQSVAPKPCSRGMYSIYPSSVPVCQRNLHHWPDDPEIINLTLSATSSWQQRLAWGDGFALPGSSLNKHRLFKAWISFPEVLDPPPHCQLKVRGLHTACCVMSPEAVLWKHCMLFTVPSSLQSRLKWGHIYWRDT